ncbi:MAG: alpha-L-rhamnosidase C-terminal domain-containing protein [Candidatus Cryptobacteroides sp.]
MKYFKEFAAAILMVAAPLKGNAQEAFFGGYSFDVVAPYLLQAGMFDIVKQTLDARENVDYDYDFWNAFWIECPGADPTGYGVYYFRKDLNLEAVPEQFNIRITAEQRYKLFVNGKLVSVGPARSLDAAHWNYTTLDLAPYLAAGKNIVGVQVWTMGPHSPESEITLHGGLLIQGEGASSVLNTDQTWKAIKDEAYSPLKVNIPGFNALDASDRVDMNKTVTGWLDADDSKVAWANAKPFNLGLPKFTNSGTGTYDGNHMLQASILPEMELTDTRLACVRIDGGLAIPENFLKERTKVIIPANSSVDILLDNKVLTNAYPHLYFSAGKDADIKLTFSESLYDDAEATRKGNRNDVEGKFFKGRTDEVISNGEKDQHFTTLSWRTYRYVRLEIQTFGQPLEINDIYGTFVGYPFKLNASIDTDNQEIKDILEIGWRTQRLCTIETYFDCPAYEQLMYLGDTRIQALITLFNSGDDRMVRNYLIQSDLSRDADGITTAHTPLGGRGARQIITPYALNYIYAISDFLRYADDEAFVEELMVGAQQIIRYFQRHQQADGRLYKLPGWSFSDWVDFEGWSNGTAQRGADGCSSLMDLQLLYAYQKMAELEAHFGNTGLSEKYSHKAEQLAQAINDSYWSAEKGLYADRAEKDHFSQHANSLAILCGLADGEKAVEIARKILEDKSLAPCSVYYKYYLHEALITAGLGDEYMNWLGIWRENIAQGLTTWAETSNLVTTRSDCHAWGASPNIEFYRTILGIDSASAGFKSVKIEPHLGDIQKIGGKIPHPQGEISVSYKRTKKGIKATVILPEKVDGSFVWKGKTANLKGGKNSIEL